MSTTSSDTTSSSAPCGGPENVASEETTTKPMTPAWEVLSSGWTYAGMVFILPFSFGFWLVIYFLFKKLIAIKAAMYILILVLLLNIGNQIYEITKLYDGQTYTETVKTCKDGSKHYTGGPVLARASFIYSYSVILASAIMTLITFRGAQSMTPGVNNRAQAINQNRSAL